MNIEPIASTNDLRPSERQFIAAMQRLGFGRFERLKISGGELVLDPWPTTVRHLKSGATAPQQQRPDDFQLKKPLVEFFVWVRGVDQGEIRVLHVHAGLPAAMETEH
jgi:hypothetical protein